MDRGTEVSQQPNVATATNPGGSWVPGDDAGRTKGHAAFGPCEDPMTQEARDTNFADIVTLPILPEPQNNPALMLAQQSMAPWGFYAIKDRIMGRVLFSSL